MELLTIDNYHKLKPWVQKYGWREFNSNINTMLMWNDTYPMYFEIFNHFALACFEYNNHKHWLMPYSKAEYLKEAVDTLLLSSKKYNITPMIHGVTQEAKDYLANAYENEIYFEYHERAGDYIYDRHQQETLVGKKMQKRRNHFNAFKKEYEHRYEYRTLSKDDVSSIYELLEIWKDNKEENEYDSIENEKKAIDFIFKHFDELDIFGGCIYIDGKLEAFNIASYIEEDMIQIHIEKANRNIRGLYVAIVKFLLETLDKRVLYVNREDDMGLESLRKAKRDMKPIYKVRKHLAVFDSITISHPNKEDIKEMKTLWLDSFEDENTDTCNFYFNHIYKEENAYILKNSTEIMAMAFINDWKMILHNKETSVSFLEGVCTKKDYQGCGIMKKLVSHIIEERKDIQLALQAYNWDIYRSLQFKETHYLKKVSIEEICGEKIEWTYLAPETMAIIYAEYTINKDGYRIHDISYYQDFYIPYMDICGYKTLQYEEKGYVSYYCDDKQIYISTIHYINEDALYNMLFTLQNKYQKPLLVNCDMDCALIGKAEKKIALMMYPYVEIENAYVNEII